MPTSKEKLTIADLMICVDALRSSNNCSDDGRVWMFTKDARRATLQKILRLMEEHGLDVIASATSTSPSSPGHPCDTGDDDPY
jgi:hypothetical protein